MRHSMITTIAAATLLVFAVAGCTGKPEGGAPPAPAAPAASPATLADPLEPLYGPWEFVDFCGKQGNKTCTPHDPVKHSHFTNRDDKATPAVVGDLVYVVKIRDNYRALIDYQNDNEDQKTKGTVLAATVCHPVPLSTTPKVGIACRFDGVLHYDGGHGSTPGVQAKADHWLVICPATPVPPAKKRIHVDVLLAKDRKDTLEDVTCPSMNSPAPVPGQGVTPTEATHYGDGHGDPP